MREVLHLHVGLRKTGSTAIQDYLFHNDPGPGYVYFQNGMANSSLIVMHAFKQDLAGKSQFQKGGLTPEGQLRKRAHARQRITEIVSGIDQPHTILSAESISIFKPEERADLYAFFKNFYEDIHVYLYVRPLKSSMESTFQETLKTRFRGLNEPFRVRFEKSISTFDRIFGREKVHVSKFAREEFAGGDVVDHFLGQLGINHVHRERSEANTSLSLPALQLLFAYRKYFQHKEKSDAERLKKLQSLPGPSMRFHSELFKALLINPEGDSQWLESRAGISIAEDIEAHDHCAIRSESDLTDIPRASIAWLKKRQPDLRSRWRIRRRDLRTIAEGVRRL